MHFQFSAVNLIAAGYIEHAEIGSAETTVGSISRRQRQYSIYRAQLIEYLNARAARYINAPVAVATKAIGPGIFLVVGNMQPSEMLFIGQRAIRQNAVNPYPVRGRFGYIYL